MIQYAGSYRIAVNGDDGCWIASSAMLPRKDGVGGFAPVLAMAVFSVKCLAKSLAKTAYFVIARPFGAVAIQRGW